MIPPVIYLDTNAVHEAGLDFSADWMIRLRAEMRDLSVNLAVPEVVADEVSHALGMKCVEAASKIKSHAAFIENVSGVSTDAVGASAEDLISRVAQETRRRLTAHGVSIFANSSPQVEELLARAVAKIPPFQSGDRGFRDCVIIESIYAHACTEYDRDQVMIVSSDRMFLQGVRQLVKGRQFNAVSCAPKDAADAFRQCFTDAVKALRTEEESLAKRFLNEHRDEIFDYVRKQKVADLLLRYGKKELENKTIKRLEAMRPDSIEWVRPQRGDEQPGARIPIQFGVLVELDLCITELGFGSMFDLEYRLDQPGPPTRREPAAPDYVESELTVNHTVHVLATVRLTENEQGYADLRLGDDAWFRRLIQEEGES